LYELQLQNKVNLSTFISAPYLEYSRDSLTFLILMSFQSALMNDSNVLANDTACLERGNAVRIYSARSGRVLINCSKEKKDINYDP
jgi:hypothetical protein